MVYCLYCHSLFIHSPTEGYLGGFHVLEVMSKAAIDSCVQCFVDISFQFILDHTKLDHTNSFWIIPWSIFARSYGKSMFSFVKNYQMVFQSN